MQANDIKTSGEVAQLAKQAEQQKHIIMNRQQRRAAAKRSK